jgi:NarL family two-component system response regulator LiaR
MISISIVEDNPDFRNVITNFLKSQDQFNVRGVYAAGETALKGLVKDAPDIAIIDIKMPGISGIELITKVKQNIPGTQYLVCTAHFDNETVFKALQAGALGYILKDADGDIISKAIIELHNGGSPMSPCIARKVIAQFQNSRKRDVEYELTPREDEILRQLAKGLLYKEIADQADISPFTVKNHLKNIYRKLQVQNKVEAVNKYKLF